VTTDQGTAANQQQPGMTEGTTGGVTTAEAPAPEVKRGLVDEKVGLKPEVGDVNFRDASGGRANRAIYGATLDFNVGEVFNKMMGAQAKSGLFLGPSTGFFYSHIGSVGGNFFGDNGTGTTTAANSGDPGANMFFLPADLKAGWTFMNVRLSAHGGGNVIYRSNANAVPVGVNSPNTTNSKWGILPNAGADLEYGVLNGGAIILRPDWTFVGSNNMFTGTLGLSLPIG
jgi:hypothetical protein